MAVAAAEGVSAEVVLRLSEELVFCEMTPTFDARTHRLIVSSVIDNIGKGAAGQAIQNMNLIMGLPETTGLMMPPMYP